MTSCFFTDANSPCGFVLSNTNPECNEVLLVDACLATSAAPTYFPSYQFSCNHPPHANYSNYHWVDGGVVANNPALLNFAEAARFVDNPKTDIMHISLGTGYDPEYMKHVDKKNKIDIDGAAFWASNGLNSVGITGTQSLTSLTMKSIYKDPECQYFRIAPKLTKVIPLDGIDQDSLQNMEDAATEIINSERFKDLIQALTAECEKTKRCPPRHPP